MMLLSTNPLIPLRWSTTTPNDVPVPAGHVSPSLETLNTTCRSLKGGSLKALIQKAYSWSLNGIMNGALIGSLWLELRGMRSADQLCPSLVDLSRSSYGGVLRMKAT